MAVKQSKKELIKKRTVDKNQKSKIFDNPKGILNHLQSIPNS